MSMRFYSSFDKSAHYSWLGHEFALCTVFSVYAFFWSPWFWIKVVANEVFATLHVTLLIEVMFCCFFFIFSIRYIQRRIRERFGIGMCMYVGIGIFRGDILYFV